MKIQKLVCILANRIKKNNDISRSEAFRKAWKVVKKARKPMVLTAFFASRNQVEARVIDLNWTDYTSPKGGSKKSGILFFADLEKVALGKYAIRSARKDNIIAA